jgi:GTP-binding protein
MAVKQVTAVRIAEAHGPAQFPKNDLPEIALAGRSNVGKSSLLNALCGQEKMARVSKTPGRTRALHFFKTDIGLTLVDFPGYGFAKGPNEDRAKWRVLIESYLTARPQLKAVAVLVDARHDPSTEDKELFDWLNSLRMNAICVATKADKLSGNERTNNLAKLKKELKLNHNPIAFSSLDGRGREEFVVKIKELARA